MPVETDKCILSNQFSVPGDCSKPQADSGIVDEGSTAPLPSSFVGHCIVVESVVREAEALRPGNNSPPEDWPAGLGFPCHCDYFHLFLYSVWEHVIKGILAFPRKGQAVLLPHTHVCSKLKYILTSPV